MPFMRVLRLFIFVTMGVALSACSTAEVAAPTATSVAVTATVTVPPPSPTETSLPPKTPEPPVTETAPIPTGTPTIKPVLELCSPLAEQTLQELPEIISDPYNPPPPGKDDRHHGTDFAYYRRKDRLTNEGEIVQALIPGQVIAVVQDQLPYGNMIIIETEGSVLPLEIREQFGIAENESLYILYAHFGDSPLVALGDQVDCGQPLGEVGATGYNIVNPHLHLEIRIGPAGAVFTAGMAYYDTRTTEEERANYELWRTSGEFRHFDPMSLIHTYLENWMGE